MKIRVGKKRYTVEAVEALRHALQRGETDYRRQLIRVTTHANGEPRTAEQQHSTLWHELVHGMLEDMGSAKHRDETFVIGLSQRIIDVNKQLEAYARGTT